MIRSSYFWGLALVLCLGFTACSDDGGDDNSGGEGGTIGGGGTGGTDPGGSGGGGTVAVCGNEVIEEGETCDDGNRDPGDGCDADCQEELPAGPCDNAIDYRGSATLADGMRYLVGSIKPDSNAMLVGSCGGDGQEAVFSFIAERRGALYWRLTDPGVTAYASGFATYALTSSCSMDAELACTGDGEVGGIMVDEPGEILLVVDSLQTVTKKVDFNLNTEWVPFKAPGEECNANVDTCEPGYLCSGTCRLEAEVRADYCEAAPVIDATEAGTYMATGTVTLPSMWDAPAGCGGEWGDPTDVPEGIVVLRLANSATKLTISTVNDVSMSGLQGDSMVYLLPTACGTGAALGCNDDFDPNGEQYLSKLVLTNVAAGDYTIVVDTWDPRQNEGAFQVDVIVE